MYIFRGGSRGGGQGALALAPAGKGPIFGAKILIFCGKNPHFSLEKCQFWPKIGPLYTKMGPKVRICPVEGLNCGSYGGHGGKITPIFWVRPPPTKNPGSAPDIGSYLAYFCLNYISNGAYGPT